MFEGIYWLNVIPLFLLQLLLTVTIEGLILYKVGYHRLLACLAYSVLANLVSIVLTVLCMMALVWGRSEMPAPWMLMATYYVVSVTTELLILRACRREFPLSKLTPVVFMMNMLSQLPVYYFLLS